MTQAPISIPTEGGRPAARAGWRLFACLAALLALAVLLVSPLTTFAEASTANAPGITTLTSVADTDTTDRAEPGQAQHCAHCGCCHTTARLGHDLAVPSQATAMVRFATWQQDGPRQRPAPPHGPPRA